MAIEYPKGLPLAQRDGYAFTPTNNIARTEMQSGRARQRVEFEATPDRLNLKWFFGNQEAVIFDAWLKTVGASYFQMTIVTPLGFDNLLMRFIEKPVGGELRGRYAWQYSAIVEIDERPTIDGEWLLLPDFVLFADIFDYSMNREWPLADVQTHIDAIDYAVNEDWPKP